mgnify:CR=1 FL=1
MEMSVIRVGQKNYLLGIGILLTLLLGASAASIFAMIYGTFDQVATAVIFLWLVMVRLFIETW